MDPRNNTTPIKPTDQRVMFLRWPLRPFRLTAGMACQQVMARMRL